jgi:hypothetical protein
MDSKSKISKQNEKLRESLALTNESNEIGNNTLNQMKANNEKMKSLSEKNTEIQNTADKSKNVLNTMMSFWRRL